MTSPIPGEISADQQQERKRKKRGAIIKFSLAGAALLGIGAAATSAQWADDAWFSASATAASVDLQGSADGTTWLPANDNTHTVVVDVTGAQLGALNQGAAVDITLYLKNNGAQTLTITGGTPAATGLLFTAITTPTDGLDGAAPVVTVTGAPTTIAAGATATAHLKVTTSATWSKDFRAKSGSILVGFTGK
ncbi:hypothetical protein ACPPVS_02125 [Cellulomonas sp. McL0617]|uniref:hypothetical protein n=1 Tax=Cellulomonas sp. McL0617 TaxID=3415675 RepID=UPI003CEE097D